MLMRATPQQLVLVSGPPASGKSTLAAPLASELGFALLSKDRIKESLHNSLGGDVDLAWSRRLGGATMALLWMLAADMPAAVLEANFWSGDPLHQAHVDSLGITPVEVHCECPIDECMRRYAERGPSRHAVHVEDHKARLSADAFARCVEPVGLGPVVTVDTTRPVDVPTLAGEVRSLLTASRSESPVTPV